MFEESKFANSCNTLFSVYQRDIPLSFPPMERGRGRASRPNFNGTPGGNIARKWGREKMTLRTLSCYLPARITLITVRKRVPKDQPYVYLLRQC